MAIAVTFELDGVSQAQYEVARGMLGESLWPGNLVHVAGPSDAGWRVFEVWESPDALGAFFASPDVGAAFQAAGIPPVQPTVSPVHTLAASAHPSA